MKTRIIISVVVLAAIVVATVVLVHKTNTSVAPSPSPSPSARASARSTPQTTNLKVYFSRHPSSDNDPSAIFAVNRQTTSQSVAVFALTELLKGPSASESAAGYFTPGIDMSGTSNCSGANFKLSVENQTATMQFCRATSLKGVVSDGQLDSEIKATLLQFPTVKKVVILNQTGNCLFDASGQNLCKQ